jgi:CRISPR-associated protein Cmr3
MFEFLITVRPLGLLYGSAGAFLSPENLVGRSGDKFPPDAATLSGLYFNPAYTAAGIDQRELRSKLRLAGPFWSECDTPENFYVPIPRTLVIGERTTDKMRLESGRWKRDKLDIQPHCFWQRIDAWNKHPKVVKENAEKIPWTFLSMLHPKMQLDERVSAEQDGLFLERAVQMKEGFCLVYLTSQKLTDGWYRFGGENHMVEVQCHPLKQKLKGLFAQKIGRSFALITPAVWGSNRLSYRWPQHEQFPVPTHALTEKPVPYRYRIGGKLGRGRYALPASSVFVLPKALDLAWQDWPDEWFPQEGDSLKRFGSGLALPIEIDGLETAQGAT